MTRLTFAAVVFASGLASACMGRVGYTATVSNAGYGPELVYAAPGVQVIADYDEPIFFVDGFYWRSDGARWYRSTYYTGGWAYAPPPPAVMRIERPHEYVHYRPQGYRPRGQGPVVRDHRDDRRLVPAPPPQRREPPPPPPRDRDRDRRDDRDHRR